MKTSSPSTSKHPALKLLGCLIKVPLGCFGFLFGGLLVVLLFLPPTLGKLLIDPLQDNFNSTFKGRLSVEELWLGSIYNDQRVDGIVLRDPEGELVLKGSMRAPDLWALETDAGDRCGPISLNLEQLNLTRDASGQSNLQRSFAFKQAQGESSPIKRALRGIKKQRFNNKLPKTLSLEISVDRISWQGTGQTALLVEDFVMAVDLTREGWKRRLEAEGQLQLAGKPLRFKCQVDDLRRFDAAAWRVVMSAEDAPLEPIRTLFASLGDLTSLVGEQVDSIDLKFFGQTPSEQRIELLLEDEGHKLNLRARWDRERGVLLASGTESGASLSVPRKSVWAERILGSAMPLGEGFAMGANSEELWMHFRDFELPLNGNLERLQANCTIEARDVSFSYLDALRREFELDGRERLEEELHLSLRDGVLIYDGLSLPAKATVIQLDGGLDLRDGERQLVIRYKRFPALYLKGRRQLLEQRRAED